MRKLYSSARIFEIFTGLQRRGLAMFLGYLHGQPMIWMDMRSPLAGAPISIATAEVILDQVLTRELEGEVEVLIGEVLDALALPVRRMPARAAVRPRQYQLVEVL